ncbi:hypothetical protein BaRGS_00006974 [Batillaria attramentaria]|uniref:CCHC-type domain-containing protein n=1 Tax=Batillaria attramentaria TaxID=370345 RepID=A0ABD0LS57_9CAEN
MSDEKDLLDFAEEVEEFEVLIPALMRDDRPPPSSQNTFVERSTIAASRSTEETSSSDQSAHQAPDSGVDLSTICTMMEDLMASQRVMMRDAEADRERMAVQQEHILERIMAHQDELIAIRRQPGLGISPIAIETDRPADFLHSTSVRQGGSTGDDSGPVAGRCRVDTPARRDSATFRLETPAPFSRSTGVQVAHGGVTFADSASLTPTRSRPACESWSGPGGDHGTSVTQGAERRSLRGLLPAEDDSPSEDRELRDRATFTVDEHLDVSGTTGTKIKRKPALYDGKTSWREYQVQFEMLAAACSWSYRQMAVELATSLREQAVGVLATLQPNQRYDYRTLVAALEARFEPRHQTEMHRAGLRTRMRKRQESLTALAQDLKKLTRKAFPAATEEVCEQLTLNAFMDALNDSEMEWNVYQGKPETVEQAVTLAMEYESFLAARKTRKSEHQSLRAVGVGDSNKEQDTPSTHPPSSNSRAADQCRYCRKYGHWKRDCRLRKQHEQWRAAYQQANKTDQGNGN